MRDLRMYILVNEDVEMGKGKLAGQVGHAVNVMTFVLAKGHDSTLNEYMNGDIKKIVLYASQERLIELEKLGFISIRDKGYTEVAPNTLTCVILPIVDYNNFPQRFLWVKELRLVK